MSNNDDQTDTEDEHKRQIFPSHFSNKTKDENIVSFWKGINYIFS